MSNVQYAGFGTVELLFFGFWLWALLKLLRFPVSAWHESGHSRGLWLGLLILALFLPCLGYVLVLWFLFSTSTDVHRAAQLRPRPGFPS